MEKFSREISKAGLPQRFFKVVRWGGGQQKQSHVIYGQLWRETGMEGREGVGHSWFLPPAAHRKKQAGVVNILLSWV